MESLQEMIQEHRERQQEKQETPDLVKPQASAEPAVTDLSRPASLHILGAGLLGTTVPAVQTVNP